MSIHDATHTIPSGMGGIFRVSILEYAREGHVKVRVHYPGEWDGHTYVVHHERLTPIAEAQ
ncbi:hypothetical protein [Halofilum ochraceum]|uniref:hypothetical protein n=1 Tax=Halofilum ochraceum TaxID=1611323 RepID=UPI0008D9FE9E|nr:hypothetical protein [Halofilum ochraceum]